jgi:hypothetical protein
MPSTFESPYNYLFTSLELLKARSPSYIMHPGTTTQEFGALILRLSSRKSTEDLVEYTLRHPEEQIKMLHEALLIFSTLILWIAPWLTAVILRNTIIGFVIQAPCLFLQDFWWWGIQFAPELMLIGFGIAVTCGCVLMVAPSFLPEELEVVFGIGVGSPAPGPNHMVRVPLVAAFTGLFCALGLVTKLIFFPLILISLFCCRTRRNGFAFLATLVLGLALALIPIYPQLHRLITWIVDLGIHRGQYGGGSVGLPEAGVYLAGLSRMVQNEPVLAIIPIVTVAMVVLLSFFQKEQTGVRCISWRTAVPVFAIQLISYLVILKAPETRYLIPLSLSLGLSMALLLYASQTLRSAASRTVGWVVLAGLLFLGFNDFTARAPATYSYMRTVTADQLRLYKRALEVTKNDVRVDYFFSDSPELPLCNGDDAADGVFGPQLERLYPNRLFFNVYNSQFETFTRFIRPEVVLEKYDHFYFLGNIKLFPKVPGFDPSTFETIDHAGDYYLQKWTRR